MKTTIHKSRGVGPTYFDVGELSDAETAWQTDRLVWDESVEAVKQRYGNVRVELVKSISSHPSLNEYRVWPAMHNAYTHEVGHHVHSLAYPPHHHGGRWNQDLNELAACFGPVLASQLMESLNKMLSGRKAELVIAPVNGGYRCVYRDLVDDV